MAHKLNIDVKLDTKRMTKKWKRQQDRFIEIAEEGMRDFVPASPSYELTNSAYIDYEHNVIHYRKVYAAYQYYGRVMTDELGRTWVRQGEKKPIIHYDWLLTYNKSYHPFATERWSEKAKKYYLRDWLRQLREEFNIYGKGRRR